MSRFVVTVVENYFVEVDTEAEAVDYVIQLRPSTHADTVDIGVEEEIQHPEPTRPMSRNALGELR